MANYFYVALDREGKKITGTVEGSDLKKIKKDLRQQGLYVVKIQESNSSLPFFSKKIKEDEVVVAIRELATFVNSGLPLDECLTGLIVQMKEVNLKKIFQQIQKDIREGKSFSQALSSYPHIFSEVMISMVRAGEETGTLDLILMRIANFLEKRQEFKSKITGIMTYPLFMVVVATGVLIFIFSFVIPKITKIFSEISLQIPVITQILINISEFLKNFWLYIILSLILLYFILKKYFSTEKGERFLDILRFHIPFLKDIFLKKEIINFSSTLSTLISGGVEIIEALKISSRVLSSSLLKNEIKNIIDFVSKGGTLSMAFKKSKYFPYLVIQLTGAGEKSGNLPEMFDKISEIYEEEVERKSSRFVSLLEPAMILFMGGIVAFIVLAVLLPIFQISQSIR